MGETRYLSLGDVVALHNAVVERMGSPHAALLHVDKLESALARPRNVSHYEGADLIRQAAVLAVGISQSQAFEDGNKRAAYMAADVFLRSNGLIFRGKPLPLAIQLELIAEAKVGSEREAEVDRFERMLRDHVVPST